MTPECKQAIDSYLDMRSRYGEKINDDSFLIREQFDIRDNFAIGKCKGIGRETLQWKLRDIARRSNVKSNQVPNAHGFRKFFTTQLVNSEVYAEIRELLLGHKIGLASAYYRPTEQKMFDEYMKAINNLTINEENRLKIKVESLERHKTNYETLNEKMDSIQNNFVEILDMITSKNENLKNIPMTEEVIKAMSKVFQSEKEKENEK
jgi:integrase/recombinase XerD